MNRLNRKRVPPLQGERRPLTWLSLAVPLLFACGQNANVPANPDPYAGGVSYPWAYTAPEGQLSAQSLTADINTLSFEKIISAKNGWGPIEVDRSNGEQGKGDGKPLTLNVQSYTRGFGVHAGSEMRFNLAGTGGATCKRFSATVGLDDEVEGRGSVVFQVYLDGVKAYDSGVVKQLSGSISYINLDIRGKKELRLVVTDAGDGISYDHADWVDPKVDCRDANALKPGTLDPSFGVGGIAATGTISEYALDFASEPDGSLVYTTEDIYYPLYKRLRPDGTIQKVPGQNGFPYEYIIRQPDGKFVVAGTLRETYPEPFLNLDGIGFLIARLNADLSPDTSFGVDGKFESDIPNLCPVAPDCRLLDDYPFIRPDKFDVLSLKRQIDGKLLMVGSLDRSQYSRGYQGAETYLNRYTTAGQLDSSFGTNGSVFIEAFYGATVIPKPDGKIVVIFWLPDDPQDKFSDGKWIVRQLNANGSLDKTFGTNGQLDKGSGFADATLEPNGNLLLSFITSGVSRLERISATGTLLGIIHPTSNDILFNLVYQADGRLLAFVYNTGSKKHDLARFKPDLSLDTLFGSSGKTNLNVGPYIDENAKILLQSDGKIVLGNVPSYSQASRYLP